MSDPIYRKDDGLGHRCVEFVGGVVVKHFPDEESFRCEFEIWRRAASEGIAPKILDVRSNDGGWNLPGTEVRWTRAIRVPRMVVLTEHLKRYPQQAQELGSLIMLKVMTLHSMGIAHRDLHAHNVIVDVDGQPYAVDWEFATDGVTGGKPYDFYGPTASGIEVPWPHRDARPDGVFWDCENVLALARHVGPLADFLPS